MLLKRGSNKMKMLNELSMNWKRSISLRKELSMISFSNEIILLKAIGKLFLMMSFKDKEMNWMMRIENYSQLLKRKTHLFLKFKKALFLCLTPTIKFS